MMRTTQPNLPPRLNDLNPDPESTVITLALLLSASTGQVSTKYPSPVLAFTSQPCTYSSASSAMGGDIAPSSNQMSPNTLGRAPTIWIKPSPVGGPTEWSPACQNRSLITEYTLYHIRCIIVRLAPRTLYGQNWDRSPRTFCRSQIVRHFPVVF